jgi:hypothetical protein
MGASEPPAPLFVTRRMLILSIVPCRLVVSRGLPVARHRFNQLNPAVPHLLARRRRASVITVRQAPIGHRRRFRRTSEPVAA